MTALPSGDRPVWDGVLVIDKSEGPTSHDVVSVARRALRLSRIGHTGTLDPLATGVLPLVIGRATRLAQYLSADDKEYDATIRFGIATDTYDRRGTVVTTSDRRPSRGELEAALSPFRGSFSQTPPAFSAKNIDGTRAYERARKQGPAAVQPKPVTVTVQRLEILSFDGDTARLLVEAGKGFYVRSLAHDLGTALGSGAVLDALRRTRSGAFGLDGATRYEELVGSTRESLAGRLVRFDALLSDWPSVLLDTASVSRVRHGLDVGPFPLPESSRADIVRLLDAEGRLVALAKPSVERGFLHASAVFG
ncbi:MAG: tRNA pseudouridine(55) synthase TruB [Vicinamibacterales bacterium]